MSDKIGGHLEVGTNDRGEVVINHPKLDVDKKGCGHIVFSPQQARGLAATLLKKASDVSGESAIAQMSREWQEVQEALQELTDEIDYGYFIGAGKWECSQCKACASAPEQIAHEEGCIGKPMDRLTRALRVVALRNL